MSAQGAPIHESKFIFLIAVKFQIALVSRLACDHETERCTFSKFKIMGGLEIETRSNDFSARSLFLNPFFAKKLCQSVGWYFFLQRLVQSISRLLFLRAEFPNLLN